MTPAQISAALSVVEALMALIPKWVAAARGRGELTEAEELAFQARQAAVFAAPYAQPEAPPSDPSMKEMPASDVKTDPTKPDV